MLYDTVPGLEGVLSSCSEETLALNDSSSSSFDFDDVDLCEKVDLIATTLGSKPPAMPLREERRSLGIECVYRAKGVGWNGVKKISKMERRKKNRKKRKKKTILKCVTDCSLFQLYDDTTPKNDNTTRRLLEKGLLALSYEQYLEYLRRCNSKTKESIEHPYLELEWPNEHGLKKRIFTIEIEGSKEIFDSAVADDYNIFDTGREVDMRDNKSLLSVESADQSATTDNSDVIKCTAQKMGTGEEQPNSRCVSFAPGPDLIEKNSGDMDSSMNFTNDTSLSDEAVGRTKDSGDSFVEKMISSGSKLVERNNMKCMAQDTTTVATSTRTLHVEPQNVCKPKREPKALQFSRASSIMDSVANSGRMISEEVLSSSPKISPENNVCRGMDEENYDDESSYESRDEARIRLTAKDLRDGAERSIFRKATASTFPEALIAPRVHRFSYYDPSIFEEVRPEEQSEQEPEVLVLSEDRPEEQPVKQPVEQTEEKSGPLSPHSSQFFSASSVVSNSSTISGSPEKKSEDKSQLSVIGQDFEYRIPMNLSYDSCHSSLYSKDQVGAKTPQEDDMISNSSFGLGDLIQQSFSLSSFQSARTNITKKSVKSTLSAEDVEYCIAYTLSELGRINSMLDEADIQATADALSCSSESTSGRDILYFARQSKNEIAALQNLIDQHIDLEKESGSFDVTPSVVSARDIDEMVINQSNSFGTFTSMKSRMSLLESPSMDRLITEVNDLCTQIEDRIENIVNDTKGGTK